MSKKNSIPNRKGKHHVIMLNDNHNTFEHVTDCIMDICGYTYLQACQCAVLVHEMGRCQIMEDDYETCSYVQKQLLREGLNVMVEKYVNKNK
jgi:ATP-dependent Clp protease adaptor protein ClpS